MPMNFNMREMLRVVPVFIIAMVFFTGCEHESHEELQSRFGSSASGSTATTKTTNSQTSESAKNFIGRWKLVSSSDSTVWYAFFEKNGSWRICNNPDGSEQRAYGSYTVSSNGQLSGNMINPGTGSGNIFASIDGTGKMTFDFEEHWHTPYKTLRFSGVKTR